MRAGGVADRAAAGDLYTAVARTRNGMQCREVAPWGPTGFLGVEVDAITVVEDGDGMVGFAAWKRGEGHDENALLTVVDLVAISPGATRELLAMLKSWHPVAPTTRFRAVLSGVVAAELPIEKARRNRIDALMHRVVDVTGAVGARSWPAEQRGAASFELVDALGALELRQLGGRDR